MSNSENIKMFSKIIFLYALNLVCVKVINVKMFLKYFTVYSKYSRRKNSKKHQKCYFNNS